MPYSNPTHASTCPSKVKSTKGPLIAHRPGQNSWTLWPQHLPGPPSLTALGGQVTYISILNETGK